jgi:hypothetical protein
LYLNSSSPEDKKLPGELPGLTTALGRDDSILSELFSASVVTIPATPLGREDTGVPATPLGRGE